MLRTMLTLGLALGMVTMCLADDKNDTKKDGEKKRKEATITKVDARNGTITVKMKDADGKEKEMTFKLTEDVRYMDSTGRVSALDIFQSGNEVLVIEADGKLKEMCKKDKDSKEKESKEKKDK